MKVISLITILLLASCARGKVKKPHPIVDPVNAKREQFRQCYHESDSYRGKDSDVLKSDVMKVGFTIGLKGKVSDARIVESSFKDPNFHACVLGIVRTINFKPQNKLVEVIQPITFYEGSK